ncbi:Uncharacterised protein [Porphyromonas cangingivalis]|nr:Uncharacterised protein [Porphyromonas cangingivalis]
MAEKKVVGLDDESRKTCCIESYDSILKILCFDLHKGKRAESLSKGRILSVAHRNVFCPAPKYSLLPKSW